MAELATIARPYAEALFKAQGSDLAATALWLDELAAVAGNAQLLQFADNPKVTRGSGVRRGRRCGQQCNAPLPEAARNFLRTVIDNGRLAALPEIASQFRALKNAQAACPTPWSTAPSRSTTRP